MTKYTPPVTRKEFTRTIRGTTTTYHRYIDGNNQRIPGVTSILSDGIPKPQLIDWAANATAEGVVNNWDTLTELGPADRLKAIQNIRYETTNRAKNKGTKVHTLAEAIVQGIEIPDPGEELRPYAENLARFYDSWNLDPVLVEVTVVNYGTDRRPGYAGTLDLVADLDWITGERQRWLLDIKTGEKGIFPETAIQLAAYRFATHYVDHNHNEQPMPKVDGTGAIHVTANDAVLYPTVSEIPQYNTFIYAAAIAAYKNDGETGIILPPQHPPKISTGQMIWTNGVSINGEGT
jgi:hypothetical protein